MLFTVRLAVRNLVRNPLRNLLSMVAVVAGAWGLIIGQAFIGGIKENIVKAAEDGLSGHMTIRPADYPTQGMQHPVDEVVPVTPELEAWLDDNTSAWTRRTIFAPWAVSEGDSLRVRAIGFDVERDADVFARTTWKVDGDIPATIEDGVLVSRGVARLLELEKGDRIVLQTRTHAGAINAMDVHVAGTVSAGNTLIDMVGIFVPGPLVEELLRTDQSTHIVMRVGQRAKAEKLAPSLREVVGDDYEVRTWWDDTKDLLRLQDLRQTILNVVVLILMGMSATGIANTILMAAYERIREIGTLRAMGMTKRDVLGMFVTEGAMIGLIGGILGAIVGAAMSYYWSVNPIDLSAASEMQGGNLPVSSFLYTSFDPLVVVGAVVFGIVVAMLASIYPAYVATKMVPAEAVRAE